MRILILLLLTASCAPCNKEAKKYVDTKLDTYRARLVAKQITFREYISRRDGLMRVEYKCNRFNYGE